jgi:hypothetical protein
MPFPEPCRFSPTAAAALGLSVLGDMGGVKVPDPESEDRDPVDRRVSMVFFLPLTLDGIPSHHHWTPAYKTINKHSVQDFQGLSNCFLSIVSKIGIHLAHM